MPSAGCAGFPDVRSSCVLGGYLLFSEDVDETKELGVDGSPGTVYDGSFDSFIMPVYFRVDKFQFGDSRIGQTANTDPPGKVKVFEHHAALKQLAQFLLKKVHVFPHFMDNSLLTIHHIY